MIRVIDYGLGNVEAFLTVFKRLGIDAARATTEKELIGAQKIILPGVGAFDHAVTLLETSGMRPTLNRMVVEDKVPVLGVCVGMQMLASSSDEGRLPGLNWIGGKVRSFKSNKQSAQLPLPHMGWNDIHPKPGSRLFCGLDSGARFYFLHSYYFDCKEDSHSEAWGAYGFHFTCAVSAGNVHGVQFHPEKSHKCGAKLLRNFAEL